MLAQRPASRHHAQASKNTPRASRAKKKFTHIISALQKVFCTLLHSADMAKINVVTSQQKRGKPLPRLSTTRYACNAPALSGHPLYEQRGSWVTRNRGASHSSRRRDETRKRGSLSLASPRNPLLYPLRATRSSP